MYEKIGLAGVSEKLHVNRKNYVDSIIGGRFFFFSHWPRKFFRPKISDLVETHVCLSSWREIVAVHI